MSLIVHNPAEEAGGYSFATSLPAYRDKKEEKRSQAQKLLLYIQAAQPGTCLKQLERLIGLPQSTVAGRVNDLIAGQYVMYDGIIEFEGRRRKRITVFHEKKTNQIKLSV